MVKQSKRWRRHWPKCPATTPMPVDQAVSRAQAVQQHEVRPDRSRSRCGWASIPSRPTSWSAARSCCRTASARRCAWSCSPRETWPSRPRRPGADEVGTEELAKKIKDGWTEFDVCIAAPDMMGLVGPLGRVLGPRGLMPSPRAGTVTPEVAKTVREYKAGKVEFRNDAGGNVHAVVGKLSFDPQATGREHPGVHPPDHGHEAARGEGTLRQGNLRSARR